MLFLCALAISVKAQSPTQNYVLSKDVLDVDGTHAITTVTYYDGLGYPVETATNGLGGTEEFYNKYSGDFKTPNQNSEKPGAKGFDYDTWWQIIYKFFQQMINKK